jgi:hypothetical protein
MTFWWPVNAAELARIQEQALQRLSQSIEHIVAGAIRTYASEAVFSDRLPKVDVPRIDRLLELCAIRVDRQSVDWSLVARQAQGSCRSR